MELEGKKTAVFGIGGAGCKIAGLLARSAPENTELIALDTNKKQLEGLDERVLGVPVGESLANKCSSFEEVKESLSAEIGRVESSLDGVDMVMIIASLGGKTGTCLSDFIAELCSEKGLFSLYVPIYPLHKVQGGVEKAEKAIKRMAEKVGGTLIVDNNLKREGGNLPMVQVFNIVNRLIEEMLLGLVYSISDMGMTNLEADELRAFFHGDSYFVVTSGEGSSLEIAIRGGLDEIGRYAEVPSVERVLVLASTPMELAISDIKAANGRIDERYSPDGIKWINTASKDGDYRAITVFAVKELPLIEGVELPEDVGDEEQEEAPEGGEIAGGDKVSEFFDNDISDSVEKYEKDTLKRPALMGLSDKKEKKEPEPEITEEKLEDESEDLDDVVNELVGFPSFKKKGQKKIHEYQDDMGIGYI
jgi:cell division GTPase FtsZ